MSSTRSFLGSLLVLLAVFAGCVAARPRPAQARQGIALGAYFWDNGLCAPGDEGAINSWRAKTGRLPAVWAIYQGWTGWNQFPLNQARRAASMGSTLMVTWEPWSGRARDSNWSCAAVAAGAYDPYIRQYARAVRDSGVPVMIRLGHEMNGDWYPWGTAYVSNGARNNGNSPQSFVAMWRHVVHIFRVEDADNALFVWSPNVLFINDFNWEQRQYEDLRALYPGDDCVDWIGLSVYNDGMRRPWRSFSQLFDAPYGILTSLCDKPLMIAELGVTEQGAPRGTSKAQWIAQTFLNEIPARYPAVRLVNYFFRDKTPQGESNFRFDSSPSALDAFRTVAASPLYRGSLSGAVASAPSFRASVSVVSSARVDPRPAALTGNNGVLRNGPYSALAPHLSAGR